MYPDALRAGRNASCAGGRVHETPLAKQADPGHPKGQPIRKRWTRRPAGPALRIFLWVTQNYIYSAIQLIGVDFDFLWS